MHVNQYNFQLPDGQNCALAVVSARFLHVQRRDILTKMSSKRTRKKVVTNSQRARMRGFVRPPSCFSRSLFHYSFRWADFWSICFMLTPFWLKLELKRHLKMTLEWSKSCTFAKGTLPGRYRDVSGTLNHVRITIFNSERSKLCSRCSLSTICACPTTWDFDKNELQKNS